MLRARRIWLLIHKWMGLMTAILVVVMGLTGSLLVFYPELDRVLNPELAATRGGSVAAPMDQVLDSARQKLDGRFLHSVFPPKEAGDVHHVWFTPSASDQSRMWEVLVDPYTAQVLGERTAVPTIEFSRENIFNTIYTLHFQLFMGEFGRNLTGFVGAFLIVSASTGLVLWWPRPGKWRQSLSVRRGAKGHKLNFDLHRAIGAYSSIALLAVAVTGFCLVFPWLIRPLFGPPAGVATPLTPPSEQSAAASTGSADSILTLARANIPDARGVACLWMPGASGEDWRVSITEADGILAAGGRAEVYISAKTGTLLNVQRHGSGSLADQFYAWQLPVHNGSALGLPGRIIMFLAGLAPLGLAITGTLIFLRKGAARRAVSERIDDDR